MNVLQQVVEIEIEIEIGTEDGTGIIVAEVEHLHIVHPHSQDRGLEAENFPEVLHQKVVPTLLKADLKLESVPEDHTQGEVHCSF